MGSEEEFKGELEGGAEGEDILVRELDHRVIRRV